MVVTKTMQAAELLALGGDARIELIDGEPFPMSPTGVLHMAVVSRLTRLLTIHSLQVQEIDAFEVWGHEGGFLLHSEPDTVLAPDIAILTRDQLRNVSLSSDAFCLVPPAIVIEVKSPSDRESEIARKLAIYLQAGVREVWWIRPLEGQMSVHWPDKAPDAFSLGQTFRGSLVLTDFSFELSELLNTQAQPAT